MFLHAFGTPTLTLPIVFNELRFFKQLNVCIELDSVVTDMQLQCYVVLIYLLLL